MASSSVRRLKTNLVSILVLILGILVVSSPAWGQLNEQDIERLREQGKQEGWTFTVGLCEANKNYSLEQLCGFKKPDNWYELADHTLFTATQATPASWDWRDLDGVTPIKNQGNCGSCWAFATVGPLECAIRIRDGITVDLSEQWLVSCNRHNWGCDGGFFAHDYHLALNDQCGDNGAVLEQYFPYVARDAACDGCPYPHDYWINGWAYIGNSYSVPPTADIKQAIMEYGPVSVGVYVTDPWYAYSGGVFNACASGTTNHAVTVVGWNDDYEGQGVWIVKNSWGTDWGEDGFMYIPYGCSLIGEGACYVDYMLSGVFFWADTTFGWTPLDVNFDAFSPFDVLNWTWDFGDGDSAFVQTPATKTYAEPGAFDVTLQVETTDHNFHSLTKTMYVVAAADTIRGAHKFAAPDSDVELVITANNSAPVNYIRIPVEFGNTFNMTYDSFSTDGCRTEYFEVQDYLHYDPWFGKRLTLRLMASSNNSAPELEAGEGPVVKLYFSVPATATIGQSATIYLDGYDTYLPFYYGSVVDYQIPGLNGLIEVSDVCCANAGDVDHNGQFDAMDIVYFVDWLWNMGPDVPCPEEADVDGTGQVDPMDLNYMVDYLWNFGPAPVPCP